MDPINDPMRGALGSLSTLLSHTADEINAAAGSLAETALDSPPVTRAVAECAVAASKVRAALLLVQQREQAQAHEGAAT